MNNRGNNRLKMYKTVQSVCGSNEAVWNGVPAFVTAYDRFTTKVNELEQLVFVQGNGTVGVKKVKDKEREKTADLAHKIASALRVWAADSENTLLEEQLNFAHSDLYHKGSATTQHLLVRVRDAAIANAIDLIAYGITQPHIDELVTQVEQLSIMFGSTRNAIVDRGKNTKLIEEVIHEIDLLLRSKIDHLVEVLKDEHHDFAISYGKAREVVDQHGKKHKPGNEELPKAE